MSKQVEFRDRPERLAVEAVWAVAKQVPEMGGIEGGLVVAPPEAGEAFLLLITAHRPLLAPRIMQLVPGDVARVVRHYAVGAEVTAVREIGGAVLIIREMPAVKRNVARRPARGCVRLRARPPRRKLFRYIAAHFPLNPLTERIVGVVGARAVIHRT